MATTTLLWSPTLLLLPVLLSSLLSLSSGRMMATTTSAGCLDVGRAASCVSRYKRRFRGHLASDRWHDDSVQRFWCRYVIWGLSYCRDRYPACITGEAKRHHEASARRQLERLGYGGVHLGGGEVCGRRPRLGRGWGRGHGGRRAGELGMGAGSTPRRARGRRPLSTPPGPWRRERGRNGHERRWMTDDNGGDDDRYLERWRDSRRPYSSSSPYYYHDRYDERRPYPPPQPHQPPPPPPSRRDRPLYREGSLKSVLPEFLSRLLPGPDPNADINGRYRRPWVAGGSAPNDDYYYDNKHQYGNIW